MPTVTDYLKYVNLQMAAEAFLVTAAGVPKTGTDYFDALTAGNLHSSKFTATSATDFASQWEVVDQKANTGTGFSGTLFRNKANPNELVLSFRSTEFIDDAARDTRATGELEINGTGWAWGQIADMEDWYQTTLAKEGGPLAGKQFAVTGYSLGGHLATAFNLLHNGDKLADGTTAQIKEVVTFNAAGVGQITDPDKTLAALLVDFNNYRGMSTEQLVGQFTSSYSLQQWVTGIKAKLAAATPDKPYTLDAAIADIKDYGSPTWRAKNSNPSELDIASDAEKAPILGATLPKSRRWRYADLPSTPANDATWRQAA